MASTKQVALWPFWMTENSINYFDISDQYTTFIFFDFCSAKSPPVAILDDRKSLLSAFLAISDQCTTFFFKFCSQNSYRRPFWMTKNHFRSHFSPFQINTQLSFFLNLFFKMAAILAVHFGSPICTKNNRIFPLCAINQWLCQICSWSVNIWHTYRRHKLFEHFYTKWPPEAILFFRVMPKIIRFL